MTPMESARFLRFGAILSLVGAGAYALDALLPRDGTLVDLVSDLVSSFYMVALVAVGWGWAAYRRSLLARGAALALLANVVVPPLAGLLGFAALTSYPALITLHVLGAGGLALALAWGGSRRQALAALVAIAGGVGFALVLALRLPWLADAGAITTALGLAALCELTRARAAGASRPGTLGAWRTAGDGARLLVLGERGRLVMIGVAFLSGIIAALGRSDLVVAIIIAGNVVTTAIGLLGLTRLRAAPHGVGWAEAAFGVGVMTFVAGTLELSALLFADMDTPLVAGASFARLFGQNAMAALAAQALGHLGQRAGLEDAMQQALGASRNYLALFLVSLTGAVMRDAGLAQGVALVVGLGALFVLIHTVSRLAQLADEVRSVLPRGAAEDVFGGAEPPGTGTREAS